MGIPEAEAASAEGKVVRGSIRAYLSVVMAFLLFVLAPSAQANWQPLTERLIEDGFDEQQVKMLFSRPEVKFEPAVMVGKVSLLLKHRQERPSSPGPREHNVIHKGFLKSRVIDKARSYLRENGNILKEATAGYCVPAEVIVSILMVETRLGSSLGGYIVFNRLASMASCRDLDAIRPYLGRSLTSANEEYARALCREKSDWAYDELKALLQYAGAKSVDPLVIRGSMYGAIGLCQFMPSNLFSYGIDADNDGRVDPFTVDDAIYSIANYLSKHGWNCNVNRQEKRKAVFAYNNSTVYVNTILAIADRIRNGARSKR